MKHWEIVVEHLNQNLFIKSLLKSVQLVMEAEFFLSGCYQKGKSR